MEILGILGQIFDSILAGTGLFGTLIGLLGAKWKGKLQTKQYEAETERKKLDYNYEVSMLKLKAEVSKATTDDQVRLQTLLKSSEDLQAALLHDQNTVSDGGILGAVRSLVRPLITFYLLFVTTYISWRSFTGYAPDLAMVENIAAQIIGFTGLALGFWFGSRPNRMPKLPQPE